MTFTIKFSLQPPAPFDFDLSAQIFSYGNPQIRSYKNGEFHQVLNIAGEPALISVTSAGSVEKPNLSVELKVNKAVTAKMKQTAKTSIEYLFNLDFRLSNFYSDVKTDSTMSRITGQLYGLKNPTTPTVFEALLDSIVEQQISIKVARTIEERFAQRFGDKLEINNETFYAFPTPQNIAAASIADIRDCGLSQRKAEYIYGAAQLIVDGKLSLEEMKNNPNPKEIIAELDAVKGIGVWTAELTMLRGMQRLDALPADDFGIRRVISTYYTNSRTIKPAEARKIAEAWGKWKGLAAYYLIIAEVKGIVV
jgi:DNA-3-methyladenine glycosylase II